MDDALDTIELGDDAAGLIDVLAEIAAEVDAYIENNIVRGKSALPTIFDRATIAAASAQSMTGGAM